MSPAFLRTPAQLAPAGNLAAVAARTSTLTGTAIDLRDFDGSVRIILKGVRTTGDLVPTIEASDVSGSGFADITSSLQTPPGATGFGTINSGTDFVQEANLDVSAVKGFVRFIGTASNTPNHTYGVAVVGLKKQTA